MPRHSSVSAAILLSLSVGLAHAGGGFNGKSWSWWQGRLRDKDPEAVERAACALREAGPEAAQLAPTLQNAYPGAGHHTKRCLIEALVNVTRDPGLGPFLLVALKDGHADVRAAATRGIREVATATPGAAAAVVAALDDPDDDVAFSAANAIPKFSPPPDDAVAHLLRLRDRDPDNQFFSNAVDEALQAFPQHPAAIADRVRRAAEAARPFKVVAPRGADRVPQVTCAEEWFAATPYFIVKNPALPGRTIAGELGKGDLLGEEDSGSADVDAAGELHNTIGGQELRSGEPVVVRRLVQSSRRRVRGSDGITKAPPQLAVKVNTVLKHNVTRGKGHFEHQSAEILSTFLWLPNVECPALKELWGRLFGPTTDASVKAALAKSPSGVIVDEIAEGMSPAEVEGILGPPERKAQIAGKDIYFYPRMKVTFRAGKVVDIE